MPETTICHGIDGRLYEKLERLAKKKGVSPEEYAAQLGAERFFREDQAKRSRKNPEPAGTEARFGLNSP